MCDICKKEIGGEDAITSSDYAKSFARFAEASRAYSPTSWWRKPFDHIVGISKNDIYGTSKNPEFDVHVGCAYDVIKKAIEEANA
jgi:hypothetical protein